MPAACWQILAKLIVPLPELAVKESMADFVLGNLGDWINGITANTINNVEPEATATLVSSSFGPQACIACSVLKPTIAASAGIGLRRSRFLGGSSSDSTFIAISKIAEDSIFANSGISVGMQITSINNKVPTSPSEAAILIRSAPRIVTIVAHEPVPGMGRIGESLVAAAVEVGTTDSLVSGISFTAMPLTECIYVSRLSPRCPFFTQTSLRTGMLVYSINNKRVRTVVAATEVILRSKTVVTILAESMTLETTQPSDFFPLAEVMISDTPADDVDDCPTAVPAPRDHDEANILPATALSMERIATNNTESSVDGSLEGTSVEDWHEAATSIPSSDDSYSSGSERVVDQRDCSHTVQTFEPDTSTYIEL